MNNYNTKEQTDRNMEALPDIIWVILLSMGFILSKHILISIILSAWNW